MRLTALPLALGLLIAACGGDGGTTTTAQATSCQPGQVDGNISFHNWSEYMDPDLIAEFEEEYDVDVVESFFDSNEAMIAQLQAGGIYDVIVPSDYMVGIMIEDGLIMELQRGAIPNLANLDPFFADPSYDPGGRYSAAYQWGTTGLGINLTMMPDDWEPSWALVFDPDIVSTYPGGFQLLNDPREAMGAALKYLGYSLNSTSLDELQEAVDLIQGVKEWLTSFNSDQFSENLVNGEVAVAQGYSGNFFGAFDGADNGDDFTYIIPKEGATLWVDNMVIPNTATSPCSAHTFIDFILDAENGARLSEYNLYATPNAAAEELLDEDTKNDPGIYPPDDIQAILEVIEDTGDFEINFTDYFAMARN